MYSDVPFFTIPVFKYLADKYLQRLKQQTAEEPELVHTSSNKIGMYAVRNHTHTNTKLQRLYFMYFMPSTFVVSSAALRSHMVVVV